MKKQVIKLEEIIKGLKDQIDGGEYLPYEYYSIRRESRFGLPSGFVFEASKSNWVRDDNREFPEFGTEEYDKLDKLSGTCCYELINGESISLSVNDVKSWIELDDELAWYLVGANETSNDDFEDDWEIILKNPVVICEL